MPLIYGQSMLYFGQKLKKMIIQSFARFLAMPASYYQSIFQHVAKENIWRRSVDQKG